MQCIDCKKDVSECIAIYRTSPFGEKFEGKCWLCLSDEERAKQENDGVTEMLDGNRKFQ